MGQDPKELVVASGGEVFVAPVGTEVEKDPTKPLDADFVSLGLITEDGVKFGRGVTIKGFKAWQRRSDVRRENEAEELSASFALEQWNGDNFAFAFGGGEVVEVEPGLFEYQFPTGNDALEETLLVIRWDDGDRHYQLAFERGNVTEGVETNLKRSDLSVLPIGYKALADADTDSVGVSFTTDDPAFEPTGS